MTHTITVLLEYLPEGLREAAKARGEWPSNGARRTRLPLEEAAELAASREYDHLVPGSEMMFFDPRATVEEQVAALISYSLEHDLVSTLRSPALTDALQAVCEGWRSDGRIWGGDMLHGYWLIRLIEPSMSQAVVEDLIEAARNERLDEPPLTERAGDMVALAQGCITELCGVSPATEEPCPSTLRDPTVPSQVLASERDARTLAEQLIASAVRTGVTARCPHDSSLDLMLRGLASEWIVGFDTIVYQGSRDGAPWRVELTEICPF